MIQKREPHIWKEHRHKPKSQALGRSLEVSKY